MKARQTGVYITVLALSAIFLALALTVMPFSEITITSDAAYPILVASLSVVFAVWIVISEERKRRNSAKKNGETQDGAEDASGEQAEEEESGGRIFTCTAVILMAMIAIYGILLMFVGYIVATLVFTVLAVTILHKRQFKIGLLVGFISTFLIVLVFKYGFSVILP